MRAQSKIRTQYMLSEVCQRFKVKMYLGNLFQFDEIKTSERLE